MLYGINVKAQAVWGTRPDFVISGPNEGNNLGVIAPHSGTLGAAVTALNKGIPAIAVSAENGNADEAVIGAALVVKLVDARDGRNRIRLPEGIGLNVNLPPIDAQHSDVDDFSFALTRIGSSANFGLEFFANLGDSPVARSVGIPSDIGRPGVSITIPPEAAGYPVNDSKRSETNLLQALVVTVSPIEGTYAADQIIEGKAKGQLQTLSGASHRIQDEHPIYPDQQSGWAGSERSDDWSVAFASTVRLGANPEQQWTPLYNEPCLSG